MFTRGDVCMLTGIDVEDFKNRARRDLLPVNADEPCDGRRRFSNAEVLRIAVADRLVTRIGYADGTSQETASKIASNNAGAIADALTGRTRAEVWAPRFRRRESKG